MPVAKSGCRESSTRAYPQTFSFPHSRSDAGKKSQYFIASPNTA
jgi:hypothetical protein